MSAGRSRRLRGRTEFAHTAHLFGAALAEAIGMPLSEYAARELFGPAGWAGQHVTVVPSAQAVIVTTGDPDGLRAGWRPARDLVTEFLVPNLA